jgi:carbon storage regulator
MLVLTRKPGEQIMIGDAIKITVVSVGHGRVKIGVEAPANVAIDRQEVYERKQHEGDGAARPVVVEATTPALHNRIADRLPVGADPRKPR